jgi:hypothetical protein
MREHFPEAGAQSRAAESNGAVPQGCGAQRSTLYGVAAGKKIACAKRFGGMNTQISPKRFIF